MGSGLIECPLPSNAHLFARSHPYCYHAGDGGDGDVDGDGCDAADRDVNENELRNDSERRRTERGEECGLVRAMACKSAQRVGWSTEIDGNVCTEGDSGDAARQTSGLHGIPEAICKHERFYIKCDTCVCVFHDD